VGVEPTRPLRISGFQVRYSQILRATDLRPKSGSATNSGQKQRTIAHQRTPTRTIQIDSDFPRIPPRSSSRSSASWRVRSSASCSGVRRSPLASIAMSSARCFTSSSIKAAVAVSAAWSSPSASAMRRSLAKSNVGGASFLLLSHYCSQAATPGLDSCLSAIKSAASQFKELLVIENGAPAQGHRRNVKGAQAWLTARQLGFCARKTSGPSTVAACGLQTRSSLEWSFQLIADQMETGTYDRSLGLMASSTQLNCVVMFLKVGRPSGGSCRPKIVEARDPITIRPARPW
jgi:hypothetical protein